uniref:Nasopharyngeal carcinoma-related protein YH1 n=1 Tax=Homo sapiens TaxID=9606 RepID=Q9HBK5_HUMAN|nr:nasopharyngeal carcinoma-related protein YH1 [Homo sapiens]
MLPVNTMAGQAYSRSSASVCCWRCFCCFHSPVSCILTLLHPLWVFQHLSPLDLSFLLYKRGGVTSPSQGSCEDRELLTCNRGSENRRPLPWNGDAPQM